MRAVRPTDAPAVAWTLARAFAPGRPRSTWNRILASVSLPFWLLAVALLPGYVHHDRRVVLRVAARGSRGFPAYAIRVAAVVGAVSLLVLLGTTSSLAAWWVVLLFASLWGLVVVGLVVVLPSALGALTANRNDSATPEQKQRDRARLRQVRWTVDSAASLEPVGGLLVMREHLGSSLSRGDVVGATAGSARHAQVYRRLGFAPLESQPLTLLHEVP